MLKRMKLSFKIGGGFGILTAIAATLGGVAVWSMQRVYKDSERLAKEYVPEVAVANEVERSAIGTMYQIRGFAYTEEESFLIEGRKNLEQVKARLKEASQLVATYPELDRLKEGVAKAQGSANQYEQLLNDTVTIQKKLDQNRAALDENAGKYVQNCGDLLDSQNEQMTREIKENAGQEKLAERLKKIAMVNDIVDLGNACRLAVWKAQAQRDAKLIQDTAKQFEEIDKKLQEVRAITRTEDDLKRVDNTKAAVQGYRTAMNDLLANWTAMQDVTKQRGVIGDQVLAEAKATAQAGMEETSGIANASQKALGTASTALMIGLGIAVVVSVILAWTITSGIVKAFKDIFKGLQTLSTAELEGTGATFNRIIEGLTDSVAQVNDAAGQVAAASQQLAGGASEQASSLEETSSALEEVAAMTRTNAGNAKQASDLAGQAREAAGRGDTTMAAINESSEQISKIIKVIEEIAFQTNLLALNAAVEAARAGEHGKGFAVVADEVRNLAQRAGQAAKETTSLIENSVGRSREGTEAIQAIVKNVSDLTNLIDGIAKASDEQAQGVEQVNMAMSQMDKVTQQNASSAEESASAAEELSAQAEAVNGMVGEMLVLVEGSTNTHKLAKTAQKSNRGKPQVQAAGKSAAAASAKAGKAAHAKVAGSRSQDNEFMEMDTSADLKEF